MKDSKRYYSVSYGAISMGMDIGRVNLDDTDFVHEMRPVASKIIPISEVPVLYGTPSEIAKRMRVVKGNELKIEYAPKEDHVSYLVPFNRIHHSRYALYFVRVDDRAEYEKSVKRGNFVGLLPEMVLNVIDSVKIADVDSETEHKAELVSCQSGRIDYNYNWRRSTDGGFMMYNLKADPNEKMTLWLLYRAADQDEYNFTIRVDGRLIKTLERHGEKGELATEYQYLPIELPDDLTSGKSDITVKIEAVGRGRSADIIDVRVVK